MSNLVLRNVNLNKLLQELATVDIIPSPIFMRENGDVDLTFVDDVDMTLVQSIIDGHDPTPTPLAPTDAERIEQLEQVINMLLMGDM